MDLNDTEPVTRRKFLDFFLTGSGLAVVTALLYPVWHYLTPPIQEETLVSSVNLGPASEFSINSWKIFRFGNKPGLILRSRDGKLRAFYATCTHLDCIVQYDPEGGDIWCACHNGRYDLKGINISGPPPRPLPPLKVNITPEAGEIVVTTAEGSST